MTAIFLFEVYQYKAHILNEFFFQRVGFEKKGFDKKKRPEGFKNHICKVAVLKTSDYLALTDILLIHCAPLYISFLSDRHRKIFANAIFAELETPAEE